MTFKFSADLLNQQKIQESLGKYNKYCSNWAELLITANDVDQLELESSTFVPDEKDLVSIASLNPNFIFSKVDVDSEEVTD